MDEEKIERLRELLDRLGHAIHASVVDSGEVKRCLTELRGDGWDAVMMLEAAMLCRHDEISDPLEETLRIQVDSTSCEAEYRLGSDDARWLASIGVSPTKHRSHPQRPLPPLSRATPSPSDDG